MRCFRLLPVVLALLATVACDRDTSAPSAAPEARVDVSLRVLVVDHSRLANEMDRLRGDWVSASGGELNVVKATTEEFLKDSVQKADVIVYPARYLGQLVEEDRLRPLRQSVVDDESLAFGKILSVVREGELRYGGEYYGVPFGSQTPVLSKTASSESDLANHDYGPAWMLLASAAPLAEHPNQVAILFDLETMDARIEGPPFVRALEELAEKSDSWTLWPPLERTGDSGAGDATVSVSLPESDEVYDWDAAAWEAADGEASRVPLVGSASYIGSVTSASPNAPAAFRLLSWLAAEPGGGAAAVSIVRFRRGRVDELTESALSARNYLHVPRIVEVDAYLAALDEHVGRALEGELMVSEALATAADQWNEITERVGRDKQRAAYRKHLNLE